MHRHKTTDVDADVRVRVEGAVGCITLCRETALNALSHAMALRIESALRDWLADDAVAMVLIDSAGGRAFCAGGDVAALYRQGITGDVDSGRQFFRDEYRLNALIGRYPKPYVAFMDGIVMGGGIGLSSHGSHRVVTERSQLALPECAIGLVPDVGGSHLLSCAPGFLGEYLGLTGDRFDASDALHAGFADVIVPGDQLPALRKQLVETADPAVIDDVAIVAEPSVCAEQAEGIDAAFGKTSLAEVLAYLGSLESTWAARAIECMHRASPLSLQLSFSLIRSARKQPGLSRALEREYRIVSRAAEEGDFLEGVRAALIDKDRQPMWKHASIHEVPTSLLAQFSEPAPDGDLLLPQEY